jgi:hypothetical protein
MLAATQRDLTPEQAASRLRAVGNVDCRQACSIPVLTPVARRQATSVVSHCVLSVHNPPAAGVMQVA